MITTVIGAKRSGRPAWLRADAAASYTRMLTAGMPTGGITDAGRTNAEQWQLWWAYLRGELAATAAYPGTSLHETGLALDLTGAALAWVRAWGRPYGWVIDTVPGEPWHVVYVPELDQHRNDPAPESGTRNPEPDIEEDDMLDKLNTLYLLRLGRLCDPAGMAVHGSRITLGTATWHDVDRSLTASAEGQAFARLTVAEQNKRRSRARL